HLNDYKDFIKFNYSNEYFLLAMPDELLGDVDFQYSQVNRTRASRTFYLRDLVKIKGPRMVIFEMMLKICEKEKSPNMKYTFESLKGEGITVPDNIMTQAEQKCKS